jgi:polyhydroxyalkanoate synthesis regulator protein
MNTIIRYPNRKLYDKQAKKYTNLTALVQKIRNNEIFQVLDNVTKTDITAKTLKQALTTVELSEEAVKDLIRGN